MDSNKRYYKYNEYGEKIYATNPLHEDGRIIINPTREYLLEHGWIEEDIPPVIDPIEVVRENALTTLSEYSLLTMERFVKGYQLNNAYVSLQMEDGLGIYSHADANSIITEYNRMGQECRNKYYEAKAIIDVSEDRDEIANTVSTTIQWYDELTPINLNI